MIGLRRERLRAEASRLLAAGVAGQVFPGATACVSYREPDGELVRVTAAAGRPVTSALALEHERRRAVDDATLYDLASLTKPIFATLCLRLLARGELSLELRAEDFIPDVRGTIGAAATLEELLTHRSGLAAWGGLYLDVPHELGSKAARRWILTEAARRAHGKPKEHAVYSDLGYIIASGVVTKSTGSDLPTLLAREILAPLELDPLELGYPPALGAEARRRLERRVAATERDDWRGRLLRGEVHDENCAAMGGVSGHAGLFGTASAVGRVARAVLDATTGRGAEPRFLPEALMKMALAPRGGGTELLGWDSKSPTASSAGKRMSAASFGHLGFTGGSVWCDPEADVAVVLLSNRVCPSRANEKIKGFRPAFHDAIMAALAQR